MTSFFPVFAELCGPRLQVPRLSLERGHVDVTSTERTRTTITQTHCPRAGGVLHSQLNIATYSHLGRQSPRVRSAEYLSKIHPRACG